MVARYATRRPAWFDISRMSDIVGNAERPTAFTSIHSW
jgi:hypothetical protein